jgi:dTMP kinase
MRGGLALGELITIEGLHGSGKSMVLARLAEIAVERGLNPLVVHSQRATHLAAAVNQLNLNERLGPTDHWTEAFLVAATLRDCVANTIAPALVAGRFILCERFVTDAFVAFQGYGRRLPKDSVSRLSTAISGGLVPQLTLLLDVSAEVGLGRLQTDAMHRMEREPVRFHERVREGYLAQARRDQKRIRIVDAQQDAELVVRAASLELRDYLNASVRSGSVRVP